MPSYTPPHFSTPSVGAIVECACIGTGVFFSLSGPPCSTGPDEESNRPYDGVGVKRCSSKKLRRWIKKSSTSSSYSSSKVTRYRSRQQNRAHVSSMVSPYRFSKARSRRRRVVGILVLSLVGGLDEDRPLLGRINPTPLTIATATASSSWTVAVLRWLLLVLLLSLLPSLFVMLVSLVLMIVPRNPLPR